MGDTKQRILTTALSLFAVNGYESVSVSQIAGALGMTKGALYKHYKNKRDIFDSIFDYVCRLDVERSKTAGVPETEYGDCPESFSGVSPASLCAYMLSQLSYWTEDTIACQFRRMLTLEQYRDPGMKALYCKVLTTGPLSYIEDLLREMLFRQGDTTQDPARMAVEFYAPFYLLLSVSDDRAEEGKKIDLTGTYRQLMDAFFQKYNFVNHHNE